jgi:hypothetical protein
MSLQGMIQLDEHARPIPVLEPSKFFKDIGDQIYKTPRKAFPRFRSHYFDGQRLRMYFTARNNGYAATQSCSYAWYLNGRFLQRSNFRGVTEPGETRETFIKLIWREGYNVIDAVLESKEPELSWENNTLSEELWSRGYNVFVTRDRAAAWHNFRSPAGVTGLEGYIQWHFDVVNLLLENSQYPDAPYGSRCRVRINRFVYADLVKDDIPRIDGEPVSLLSELGYADADGRLIWNESPTEVRTGRFTPGHGGSWEIDDRLSINLLRQILWQLGLPDFRVIDVADENWLRPANTQTTGLMTDDQARVLDELSILHLNTIEKLPRGYRGELYFGQPETLVLRCLGADGEPLNGASVNLYQRGVQAMTDQVPVAAGDSQYWPVHYAGLDDEAARAAFSNQPVIQGTTNNAGELILPNRPAAYVRTLTLYERKDNPFGEIDPLGWRGVFHVEVNDDTGTTHFQITAADAALLWQRGDKERGVLELQRKPATAAGAGEVD